MTVSTNIAKKTYAGNGSTTAFDLGAGFIFFNSSELVVTVVDDTTGVETAKTITTDYTVSGGSGNTGTVTMLVAPASGETLVIQRVMPLTQGVDFVNNSASDAEVLEDALDKLVLGQQQLDEADARTLKAPVGEASIGNLPTAAARRAKLLAFEDDVSAAPYAVAPVDAGLTVASAVGQALIQQTTKLGMIQTGLGIDPLLAESNLIINGDFNSWQEGTSFAAIADSTFVADLFQIFNNTSTGVITVSRSTDVPTVAQSGHKSNYSLLVDVTTPDSSIAAGERVGMRYKIEGYDFLKIAQRPFRLGFWVKATKTGIYTIGFRNSGADRGYAVEYTVNATNTWEYKIVTVTASPSAGTWNYTNGVGLVIDFWIAAGSNLHTTADAWQTGNVASTANQVNGMDSASNDFRLAQLQLNPGSVALPFVGRSFQQEMGLIGRYLERIVGDNLVFGTGYADSSTSYRATWKYSHEKRTAPTISGSAATSAFEVLVAGGTIGNFEFSAGFGIGVHCAGITCAGGSSLTAGQGLVTRFTAGNGGFLQADARL